MNVDVQEFYPRVQLWEKEPEINVNCDVSSADLATTTVAPSPKPKIEALKVTKTSHTSKAATSRVSKKEIIEGIKSMEQQNIDLAASKPAATTNATQVDEWNVIKKGKKVKVVKDIKLELDVHDVKKDKVEEVKIEEMKVEVVTVTETAKKPVTLVQQKSKKTKNKSKKKKPQHMLVKQNGFEIIEPEFNCAKAEEVGDDDETQEMSDDEPEITESEVLNIDGELFEKLVLNGEIENEIAIEKEIEIKIVEEAKQEKTPEANDLEETLKKIVVNDDAVIDISDEDICCKITIPIEALVQEAQEKIEVLQKPEIVAKKPEVLPQELGMEETRTEVLETPMIQVVKKEVSITKEAQKQPEIQQKIQPEVLETLDVVNASEVSSKPKISKKLQTEAQKIKKPELKLEIHVAPEVKAQTEVVKKPEVSIVQTKVEESKKQPEVIKKQKEVINTPEALPEVPRDPFQDSDYLNDRTNIAALERDLMENLRLLDEDFDLKSPIINPLYDFPITSAVRKWLQEKETESFDSLFHVQNLKKLSELYEDEDDETESDISEKEVKSETDSDYASDFQAKANGSSPTCSTHAKGSSSKCNKLIAKESFCALM